MIRQLAAQELQEAGFRMAPGALQSHPEGEPITGPEYKYGLSDKHLARLGANTDLYPNIQNVELDADEEFDFADEDEAIQGDAAVLRVSPVTEPRLYADIKENKLTKNTLHHMILEELDALQEAGITGKKMFRGGKSYWGYDAPRGSLPGYNWVEGGNVEQPDGSIKHVAGHYAGRGSNLSSPRGSSKSKRRRLKPNWKAIAAGAGGLALGGLIGAAAAGGSRRSPNYSRRRPSYPESRMSDRYHPSYSGPRPSYGGRPASYNMTPGVPRGRSMIAAEQLYDAMKGGGTDEELIWDVLESNLDTRKIRQLSRAYDRVLAMNDDADDGSLVQWLRDDGMDQAAEAVLMLMNGQEIDRYQIKFMREEDDA